MIKCIFDQANGQYVGGSRHDIPEYDSGTQVLVELPDFPDRRTERWDGASGVRAATAQEMADYDDNEADAKAQLSLAQPVNVVLRDVLWDAELRLRAAGQVSGEADIEAATSKTDYTQALKARVKEKL